MVKLLLKKLMKKFSFEIVYENLFESKHKDEVEEEEEKAKLTGVVRQGLENLLTNLKKLIEKEKQRKLEEQTAAKKGSAGKDKPADLVSMYTTKTSANPANEIEELLKESSSEDEDEAKNDRASQRTSAKNGKKQPQQREKKKKSSSMDAWLQENENEDPLDLLDPMAMKRVLATKPLTKEQIEKKKAKQAEKNRGFKMSADGRLMIDDDSDEDDRHNDRKSHKSKKGQDDIDEMMDTLSLSKKSMKSSKSKQTTKKRQMDSDDDDDSDEEMDKKSNRPTYKAGGTGIHRPQAKKTVEFGSEYRAKKAAGDVKVKNKPDPYAYIPFNYGKLNKRKKAKLEGEFRGVVKAVKRAGSNVTKGRNSNRK